VMVHDHVAGEERGEEPIHLPSPTYAPLIAAFGVIVAAYAAIYLASSGGLTAIVALIGFVILGYGIVTWVRASHADAPH
jgi:cytochrome c oxidase subunit 1